MNWNERENFDWEEDPNPKIRYSYVKKMAQSTLKRYIGTITRTKLPINVNNICSEIGYQIILKNNLPKGLSELVLPAEKIIGIEKTEHVKRQRFSISHAIGHIEIGHDLEGLYDEHHRIAEGEANYFAGHLLVPTKVLKDAVKRTEDIIDLSDLFCVSKHVIVIRMTDERIL